MVEGGNSIGEAFYAVAGLRDLDYPSLDSDPDFSTE